MQEDFNPQDLLYQALKSSQAIPIGWDEYFSYQQDLADFPFFVSEDGICKVYAKAKNAFVKRICSFLTVKEKEIDRQSGQMQLVLEWYNGKALVTKRVERKLLSKSEIPALLQYGVSFLEKDSNEVLEYLLHSDRKACIKCFHTQFGWSKQNDDYAFQLEKLMLPKSGKLERSQYRGGIDVAPKGDLTVWLDMVKQDVLPFAPLTTVMLLGFASPVLAFLNEKNDLGSPIFSLSNDSSKGKTTAAMLAVSAFSNPTMDKGLLRSFNSTENYLMSFLSTASSLPIAFDEAAVYKGDMAKFLYLVAGGVEKGRCATDASMKQQRSWNSMIIATAEFDLVDDHNPNGLKARCFPIAEALTKDATQADRIKRTIISNYGVAGKRFVQWLLDNKMDDMEQDYENSKQLLETLKTQSGSNSSSLTPRILSKLAVVLQTAHYFTECFGLELDCSQIEDYLLSLEQKASVHTDLATEALECILQEVGRASSRYMTKENSNFQNALGRIIRELYGHKIIILKGELESVFAKNGFQSTQILKQWKQDGILEVERDRLTKRVTLHSGLPPQPCYILCIKHEIDSHSLFRNEKQTIEVDNYPTEEYSSEISEEELQF